MERDPGAGGGSHEKVGISKKQANLFFLAQAELAYKQAKNSFVIPGVGKLVLTKSKPREMVMQFGEKKGQTVKVPAGTTCAMSIFACGSARDARASHVAAISGNGAQSTMKTREVIFKQASNAARLS